MWGLGVNPATVVPSTFLPWPRPPVVPSPYNYGEGPSSAAAVGGMGAAGLDGGAFLPANMDNFGLGGAGGGGVDAGAGGGFVGLDVGAGGGGVDVGAGGGFVGLDAGTGGGFVGLDVGVDGGLVGDIDFGTFHNLNKEYFHFNAPDNFEYDGLIPGEGHGSNDLGGDDAAAAPVSIGGDDAASAAPGYNYENA